ncbi:cupredoxin domain-containing protein [Noviherbaspirillum denitrificans]|uniref:Copper-binding protein n=1 Tax=Noviherbaspirillum denitrificans TaxID=1968433 RepID=A0A254TGR5_9BURK|nr:cupredoxin family copper-binding protein [Noviherbaspirillum denitrificans]OWW21846.1 copper-binding protein [Noviherbaspirillum denitrificans]
MDNKHRRRRLAKICVLAGLFLVASVAAKAAEHTVVIEGMQFAPATLEVRPGDTVIWKNKDPYPHTATAVGGSGFDSGEIKPDRSWKFVAKKAGTFPYECTLHKTMTGKLVVK